MDDQAQPQRIGLEVSKGAKVGCVAAIVVLFPTLLILNSRAVKNGKASSTAATLQLYRSASEHNFDAAKAVGSQSSILTLQKAEELNGPISTYVVTDTITHVTGRPSEVHVDVVRRGKHYIAVIASRDSKFVDVVIEAPKDEFDKGDDSHAVRVVAPGDGQSSAKPR